MIAARVLKWYPSRRMKRNGAFFSESSMIGYEIRRCKVERVKPLTNEIKESCVLGGGLGLMNSLGTASSSLYTSPAEDVPRSSFGAVLRHKGSKGAHPSSWVLADEL
ncbi:hypothetical protein PoB_007349700 [Plakobranchus ocellatus]|uniref:Uncharacterized protein n=1 Tax=Plakobranchus ocellatus TaxID=259542 RepID=A0AAV4DRQ8_9GAST|nr:hypothetical protein PoB_007349700 [Plakobranchus ocellatus]